ncbi:hypothetical protein WJX77_004764 [Trebouxia sp. C0004]
MVLQSSAQSDKNLKLKSECFSGHCNTGHRLFDAVGISSVRDGPDDSSIAVDLLDASFFVPEGTADASAADATAVHAAQLAKQSRHVALPSVLIAYHLPFPFQTSRDGASGNSTVTSSSSGHNVGASAGLTSVATSGHLQASSSSIADATASDSRAQVHSEQHTSSSGEDLAKPDVTNSVDGKTAMVKSPC